MAAGLGFKTFTTGEVLTAGDVNGYLMQGILVFATEAARNSAITSPQEGQFAFTKDTNSLWYYTGAAWVASAGTTLGFNAQTGTTYTLVAADASNKLVTTSNAAAVTVTVPPSVFAAGEQINLQSIGVGLTSFAQGAGVTITSTGASAAAPILRARYSACTIICTGSNTFTILGDLS
jgi:hypothetical protein